MEGMQTNLDPTLESTRGKQTSPGLSKGMKVERNFLRNQIKERTLGTISALNPSTSWDLVLMALVYGPLSPNPAQPHLSATLRDLCPWYLVLTASAFSRKRSERSYSITPCSTSPMLF